MDNIKLTLTQWLLVVVSAACGVLVLLFKLQGSKLHKARIDLLNEQIKRTNEKQENHISSLKKKFKKSLKEYKDASK